MLIKDFITVIYKQSNLFAVGVPDSQLQALCDYLMQEYGIGNNHIVAANEGNCAAIAAGHYLATKEIPLVYLQNSGIGNIVNPIESLLKIYKIPCIFVIGWRGEPGVKDEPQHLYQGKSTLDYLSLLDIPFFNVRKETTQEKVKDIADNFQQYLEEGRSVAYVISKGALVNEEKIIYRNDNLLCREDALEEILTVSGCDPVVSSTGKISREIYEIRERNQQSHERDFLTVGSMGHCSSIAFGIASGLTDKRVWCIDGDGALLMHMGAIAVIGTAGLDNLVHIVINNSAHESVGGIPTVASGLNLISIAKGCGYQYVATVNQKDELKSVLNDAKEIDASCFIEIKTSVSSRSDLGRPKESPVENRNFFINFLQEKKI